MSNRFASLAHFDRKIDEATQQLSLYGERDPRAGKLRRQLSVLRSGRGQAQQALAQRTPQANLQDLAAATR